MTEDTHQRLDRLESLVEQQQETIERQQATIERQRERIDALEAEDGDAGSDGNEVGDADASGNEVVDADASGDEDRSDTDSPATGATLTRRSALKTGGLLGLLGFGTGYATASGSSGTSASPQSATPTGQVGTGDRPLDALYTQSVDGPLTGGTELTDLAGSGLSISSGTLNASGAAAWTDGDATDLLEPSDGTKAGVEVDKVADDGSGAVTMGSPLDLDGNNLASRSVGSEFRMDLDSEATNGDERFNVLINDVKNSTWTVEWRRMAPADVAFDVFDVTNDTDLFSVNDDGSVDVHSGDLDLNGNKLTDTASINGGVTGDTDLRSLSGDGLAIDSGALGIATGGVDSEELANDSLTVAGNSVSLGGSTGVDYVDLGDTGASFPIPNGDIENSSVTVTAGDGLKNGGSVSLGGSTTLGVNPADFAGSYLSDDGSDNLTVNIGNGLEGDASDNIRVDVSAIAGTGLSEGSNTFDINTGPLLSVDDSNDLTVSLSALAGDNLTVDTTNDELDAEVPAFEDPDSDNLLETAGSEDGIDVTTVQVTNLNDASGNSHLTLNDGGTLGLNQTLNTNGNGIQSGGSVSVDIDANGTGTSETFTVSKDGNNTTLLTVNESGKVGINSGDLDVSGAVTVGDIPAASGTDLGFDSNGQLVDISSSSARYKTDIRPLDVDTERVLDLEPKAFEYERDGSHGVGFVAEEADETFPEVVRYDERGHPDGINYKRLAVYLLPEIRDNRARLADLEAENERLRERLAAVETELGRTADGRQGAADD